MTVRITVLDGCTVNPGDNPWDPVAELGELTVYDRTEPELTVERARGSRMLLTNKTCLDAGILERLPELRYVGVLATGYNVVDIEAAARLGIAVTNIPEYGTASVAQHTMALLLALTNHVALHDAAVHAGEWSSCPDFAFWKRSPMELSGKTFGVVGMGKIGGAAARAAAGLGMRIVAHNPRSRIVPEGLKVEWLSMEELFRVSDVVSLHCPLTPSNRGFVGDRLLRLMKRSAFLLNTARGPLVDEAALSAALNAGILAGAAVDVAAIEPIPADSPLLRVRNCIITPHLAWASLEARRRLMVLAADNIRAFLAGTPRNVVNGAMTDGKG